MRNKCREDSKFIFFDYSRCCWPFCGFTGSWFLDVFLFSWLHDELKVILIFGMNLGFGRAINGLTIVNVKQINPLKDQSHFLFPLQFSIQSRKNESYLENYITHITVMNESFPCMRCSSHTINCIGECTDTRHTTSEIG